MAQLVAFALAIVLSVFSGTVAAADLPRLDQPVNDFAHVVDSASAARLSQLIRQLQASTGDVVVVATVPTIEPYVDIN